MAFHVGVGELGLARATAERALRTIHFRHAPVLAGPVCITIAQKGPLEMALLPSPAFLLQPDGGPFACMRCNRLHGSGAAQTSQQRHYLERCMPAYMHCCSAAGSGHGLCSRQK
jgi:hypothetical protein